MELVRLYWQRIFFWFRFVGRDWEGKIGPILAWQLACIVHPMEDMQKWWLGTGWTGPETDLYVERIYFPEKIQEGPV